MPQSLLPSASTVFLTHTSSGLARLIVLGMVLTLLLILMVLPELRRTSDEEHLTKNI